jgi:hypothetical protein
MLQIRLQDFKGSASTYSSDRPETITFIKWKHEGYGYSLHPQNRRITFLGNICVARTDSSF